ncbi:short-chain dehydrogenase [Veronia nyctiphanis]|uniref:Short-chain dehydrogenase n=1 Tax=Veronia nyctiphanis TaxID=1278244 RepID=A0A4Q0YX11_9GAMM|nr:SDR family oxidoreductase [Veronia nyctiphanis]RXJ74834.1 short-chain dehydrogenase [Veronia nyctiphanis]
MDIAKSVIVITAAGSPTGRAMAEHFCSLHARVALVDTNCQELQATYEACQNAGGICLSFVLADKSTDSISAFFQHVSSEMGAVDVLINYWQTGQIPSLLATSETEADSISDVASNLYLFGRGAAFSMLNEGRQGVIVNIPDNISKEDYENSLDSCNAIIRGLTQSWAKELAPVNIRVAGVLPTLRSHSNRRLKHDPAVNYDMIDGAEYIVANDSFTGRILEAAS